MTITKKIISKGFILAGLANLSILVLSRFFTNRAINEADPHVMSNFGLIMIVLWGLAYISVAKNFSTLKGLVAIFAVEKLVYAYTWVNWIFNNDLSKVYEKDTMAGAFYSIYGINDAIFCLFFIFVFISTVKAKVN